MRRNTSLATWRRLVTVDTEAQPLPVQGAQFDESGRHWVLIRAAGHAQIALEAGEQDGPEKAGKRDPHSQRERHRCDDPHPHGPSDDQHDDGDGEDDDRGLETDISAATPSGATGTPSAGRRG